MSPAGRGDGRPWGPTEAPAAGKPLSLSGRGDWASETDAGGDGAEGRVGQVMRGDPVSR